MPRRLRPAARSPSSGLRAAGGGERGEDRGGNGPLSGAGTGAGDRGGAGAVDPGRARAALDLFDQVRAMTWRLLHPRG